MAFVFVMILHMKIDWSMPHNDNDKRQNSTIDASLNLPKHNNKKITSAVIRTLCQISVLPHHIVSPYHQQLSVYSYYWFFSPHHTRTCVAWTVCIKL